MYRSLRVVARGPRRPTAAPFFSTRPALRLKEDADRSPAEVEAAKQQQLKEQREGKGQWKEELASKSEASVAADKQKVDDHEAHMKELQKKTAQSAEKEEK